MYAKLFVVHKLGESANEGKVFREAHGGHSCAPWVDPSYDNGKHGSLYIALLKHDRGLSFPHDAVTTVPWLVSKVNKESLSLVPRLKEEEKGLGVSSSSSAWDMSPRLLQRSN